MTDCAKGKDTMSPEEKPSCVRQLGSHVRWQIETDRLTYRNRDFQGFPKVVLHFCITLRLKQLCWKLSNGLCYDLGNSFGIALDAKRCPLLDAVEDLESETARCGLLYGFCIRTTLLPDDYRAFQISYQRLKALYKQLFATFHAKISLGSRSNKETGFSGQYHFIVATESSLSRKLNSGRSVYAPTNFTADRKQTTHWGTRLGSRLLVYNSRLFYCIQLYCICNFNLLLEIIDNCVSVVAIKSFGD